MVYRMLGMILILLFIGVGAIIATDSLWWGVGITLFICVAILSVKIAAVIAFLFVASLFLFQDHL